MHLESRSDEHIVAMSLSLYVVNYLQMCRRCKGGGPQSRVEGKAKFWRTRFLHRRGFATQDD